MKSLVLIALMSLAASTCVSQVSAPNQDQSKQFTRSIYGLGVSASVVSGFGLSFRQHLPSEFSYQLVFGIIKTGSNLVYNIGGEAQYDIIRASDTRFYVCGGAGYFYSGESSNSLSGPVRIGGGVGGEWRTVESFDISGGLLFTYFDDGTILPLPEMSLYYYFD